MAEPIKLKSKPHKDLQGAYARLFASKDGKIVLADLTTQFYDNDFKNENINREVGKRDVIHFIKQRIRSYAT